MIGIFGYPAGLPAAPGVLSRPDYALTTSFIPADPVPKFGAPMKWAGEGGGVGVALTGGEDLGSIAGVVVVPFPPPWPVTDAPELRRLADCLLSGHIWVRCRRGKPLLGGDVYLRTVAIPGYEIGEFEAIPDEGRAIRLRNATFCREADRNNNTEILIGVARP